MQTLATIDAHVGGEGVRLVVGGGPSVAGRTMGDKLAWLKKQGDELRRGLMLEPRGHGGMQGALLTEPVSPHAHAGVLSIHAGGFPQLSGESVIAAVTIALENNLLHADSEQLLIDTPAGVVRARPMSAGGARRARGAEGARVTAVELEMVPSFVFSAGFAIQFGRRAVRVDIAFGGEFYAIVDSESVGIPVDAAHGPQLAAAAVELSRAVEKSKPVSGVIFTAPPRGAADLRSATVLLGLSADVAAVARSAKVEHPAVLRRSAGATGTCALLAVLDAMGLVAGDQTFTHESVIGTVLRARVLSRHTSDDVPQIVPMVEASAWITGRHQFEIHEEDPLKHGFAI